MKRTKVILAAPLCIRVIYFVMTSDVQLVLLDQLFSYLLLPVPVIDLSSAL